MRIRSQFKILFSLLLSVFCFGQTDFVQDSVRLSSPQQTATMRSLQNNGIHFVSANELAQFLKANYFENSVLKKSEIKLPNVTLKFTAENPFVAITDIKTKRQSVRQFSRATLQEKESFLVPVKEVIILLNNIEKLQITIESDTAAVDSSQFAITPHITGYQVDEKKNGSLFRIQLSGKVKEFSRTLQIGEWIYVSLVGAECDTTKFDSTFSSGLIRRVKPVRTETSVQLSLQVRGKISQSEIIQDQTSNDILLTLIPEGMVVKTDQAENLRRINEQSKQRTANTIEKQKRKWKFDVVVLDAGHGGHDPGAIGIIGTREKDITLGISLKLGEMIQKEMPDVKVVYTRKTDRFVELYRRGQIANENEGKLFISIHCNSTERKPSNANGFEIYLLRPGKTEDAIKVAEKENAVVKLEKDFEDRYQELNDENFIILTMAQSSYVKQSERFAEMLEETMSAQMEGQRQPVKQAGFYVLVGASMPNVLIETGYLSNPKDERFLRSPEGQKKIALSILNALKAYKNEYESDFQ